MADDLAAANVNRSYQLAASSIAIFTFLRRSQRSRYQSRRDARRMGEDVGHPDLAAIWKAFGRKPAIWSPPPQDYFSPALVFRAR